jgi:hypothetical protein
MALVSVLSHMASDVDALDTLDVAGVAALSVLSHSVARFPAGQPSRGSSSRSRALPIGPVSHIRIAPAGHRLVLGNRFSDVQVGPSLPSTSGTRERVLWRTRLCAHPALMGESRGSHHIYRREGIRSAEPPIERAPNDSDTQ